MTSSKNLLIIAPSGEVDNLLIVDTGKGKSAVTLLSTNRTLVWPVGVKEAILSNKVEQAISLLEQQGYRVEILASFT